MSKNRFKEAREMSGMSTKQAVRFSKGRILEERIVEIENGTSSPSEEECTILSETYEVQISWLKGSASTSRELVINARGLENLDPDDLAKLMRQMEAYG